MNKIIKSNLKEIISIILILIPISLLFGREASYTVNRTFFGYNLGPENYSASFKFGMISTTVAVLVYFPIIIRNYSSNINNIFNWCQHIANIILLSLFLNAVLGDDGSHTESIIPLLNITVFQLLAVSILFSWLGLSSIAGFSWIFCFIGILINLQKADIGLDNIGGVVILLPFCSILLQLFLPGFGIDNLSDFGSQFFNNATGRIKGDMHASISTTKKAIGTGVGIASKGLIGTKD